MLSKRLHSTTYGVRCRDPQSNIRQRSGILRRRRRKRKGKKRTKRRRRRRRSRKGKYKSQRGQGHHSRAHTTK